MIKRLGTRTPGRTGETLAQATVVNSILPLISRKPERDRYRLAKGKKVGADDSTYHETPLRALWVNESDDEIARLLLNFFAAVSEKWPHAWRTREKGIF